MSYYELMVLFSSTLTEEEERAQALQVEELLKREKAELHLVDHWGKKKLAYPIKKQRQGYYEWFYFELDPSRITEIDRKLKMSEVILRFMALRMEKIQIQNLRNEMVRRAERAQQQTETPPASDAAVSDAAVTDASASDASAAVEETQPVQEVASDDGVTELVPDPEQEMQEQSGGNDGDAK